MRKLSVLFSIAALFVAALPALAGNGSVRGSGEIAVGRNTGAFNIGVVSSDRGISGSVQFVEHDGSNRLVGIQCGLWRSAEFGRNTARLVGMGTYREGLRMVRCVVEVHAVDGGTITSDSFGIVARTLDGRVIYSARGTVERGGRIVITSG